MLLTVSISQRIQLHCLARMKILRRYIAMILYFEWVNIFTILRTSCCHVLFRRRRRESVLSLQWRRQRVLCAPPLCLLVQPRLLYFTSSLHLIQRTWSTLLISRSLFASKRMHYWLAGQKIFVCRASAHALILWAWIKGRWRTWLCNKGHHLCTIGITAKQSHENDRSLELRTVQ